MPSPEQELQGVPEEELHLELDVSGDGDMEAKIACILCHRTQVAPDWPYHRVPRHVTARILGREFYVRAHPPVADGETSRRGLLRGDLTLNSLSLRERGLG